ncbi:RluA family pseudouridine synthase [Paenibacillus sp. LHD-117]|uniref:RluA family pseudouridine synthase n=1 Tax=Paenibacillus sp. LHD-117 TaxID=3071412 RepID=UPI0027DF4B5E|nr:RluA family pseudouridine synthase [Paenibacillus sp. LHD-117]MDQ6418156.1 RluA family pseudouridine synthase [Paenibacillus sp. LHD-117]
MAIRVLFEDNHVLAVVKPPGIPSQEDETRDPDMLTLLKEDLKVRHNKPGNVFLGLVHRLDRPVGGAMVFAKTSKAASRLSEAVRSRMFGKTYMCVVQGTPAKRAASLTHYIRKDSKRNQVSVFDSPAPEAKEAILDYAVMASNHGFSLIAVKLHTGRPHQIRAQMAFIGCPLVGDLKYGAARRKDISEILLWSTSVSFPHPVTKEMLTFRSLPESSSAWAWWTQDELDAASTAMLEVGG